MQAKLFKPGTLELTRYGNSVLIHELTHVWQYQHVSWGYAPESLAVQLWAVITTFDRNNAYRYSDILTGKPFYLWNVEQPKHSSYKTITIASSKR